MDTVKLTYAVSLNFTMEMDRRFNEAHIGPTHEDLVQGLMKALTETPNYELALEKYDVIEVS